jgi:hypothetical protein
MKFPSEPRKGDSIREDFMSLLRWCKASRIVSVTGGLLKESPNGSTLVIPDKSKDTIYKHPFELMIGFDKDSGETRLFVNFGIMTTPIVDSGNYITKEIPCLFSLSTELANDPFAPMSGSIGYHVLSASQTVGVWLKVEVKFIDSLGVMCWTYTRTNGAVIEVSTTYTDYDDADDYSTSIVSGPGGYAVFYLGKVVTDDQTNVTSRLQWRRSDINLPTLAIGATV